MKKYVIGFLIALLFVSTAYADSWTVTQYGMDSVSMFYTIENDNGDLVIIDGGFPEQKDQVAQIIQEHNNHVSVWILTHPHADHVGAFDAIQSDPTLKDSILIDRIYVTPVNAESVFETANSWDNVDAVRSDLEILSEMDNVVPLYENDEFDMIGLNVKVISAWDENVDSLQTNLLNKGSIMFMVSGLSDRMLFCSDVEAEMEQFIIPKHYDELKADYIQLGHHGNWGLSTDFYAIVDAKKGVFADAPSYVLDDTTGKYDGPVLKQWFLNQNIPYYQISTAPNSITIY